MATVFVDYNDVGNLAVDLKILSINSCKNILTNIVLVLIMYERRR